MRRDLLEYAKWYLYEEDYFISNRGILIHSYPRCKRHIVTQYESVHGFRYYIPDLNYNYTKIFNNGKPIDIVPRDIVPILYWELE